MYKGKWKNNMMHGEGKYHYKDGRIYEGNFVMDRKDGEGKMYFPDGTIIRGIWDKGKL